MLRRCLLFVFLICLSIKAYSQEPDINWIDIQDLEAAMAVEKRPVLLDFYTSWCGWCKRMDKTTFIDSRLIAYVNQNYYAVKFNAEQKEVVNYRGQEFNFVAQGRRGYNELAAGFLKGQMSYPTLVILNTDLEILQNFRGYRTADELMPILTYLGEQIYTSKTWDVFIEEWDGE